MEVELQSYSSVPKDDETDVLDVEAWVVNLENYSARELPAENITNNGSRLTKDGRPTYVLESDDERAVASLTAAFSDSDAFLDIQMAQKRVDLVDEVTKVLDSFATKTEVEVFDLFTRVKQEVIPAFKRYRRVLDDQYISDASDPRCIIMNNMSKLMTTYRQVVAHQIEYRGNFVRDGLSENNQWHHMQLKVGYQPTPLASEHDSEISSRVASLASRIKRAWARFRDPPRAHLKTLDKNFSEILSRAAEKKLATQKAKSEAERRKLLATHSILERKILGYIKHWLEKSQYQFYVMSGALILIVPLLICLWSVSLMGGDYGDDYNSDDLDVQDQTVHTYLYFMTGLYFVEFLCIPIYLILGERQGRFKVYYYADRLSRVRPVASSGISLFMAIRSFHARYAGTGPTVESRFFTFYSGVLSPFILVLTASYMNSITLRPARDLNYGKTNRIILFSVSRFIAGFCCCKAAYRTDLGGKGLKRLETDYQKGKDILKAMVTQPGWRINLNSVRRVQKQRTKVNRYLRCLDDMKLDKAINMLSRIYDNDILQGSVAEIVVGCVHYTVYDRILEFADVNKRIQEQYDAIQDIYSVWRDMVEDLKLSKTEDEAYQKWLRINHFIVGSADKGSQTHGRARIFQHVTRVYELIKEKTVMNSRGVYDHMGRFNKSKDWTLASRCLNRIAPLPRGWERVTKHDLRINETSVSDPAKVDMSDDLAEGSEDAVQYRNATGKIFRSFQAMAQHLHEVGYDLPLDKLWTPRNTAATFEKIQKIRHERILDSRLALFYKLRNKEIKIISDLEWKIRKAELKIEEKHRHFEITFRAQIKMEFKKYLNRAKQAILKHSSGKLG